MKGGSEGSVLIGNWPLVDAAKYLLKQPNMFMIDVVLGKTMSRTSFDIEAGPLTMETFINQSTGKFWSVSQKDRSIVTISGVTGKNGRTTTLERVYSSEAGRERERLVLKKLREGFAMPLRDVAIGALAFQYFISRVYTGFLSLAYSPRDQLLVVGRPADESEAELLLINVLTSEVITTFRLPGGDIWKVDIDEQRRKLYCRVDETLYWISIDSRTHGVVNRSPALESVNFQLTPDGRRMLASNAGRLECIDLETGTAFSLLTLSRRKGDQLEYHATMSQDGTMAAIGWEAGKIEIYDLVNRRLLRCLSGDFSGVRQLQFHPSNEWLGMVEHYGSEQFRLWNISTGEEAPRFETISNGPAPHQSCGGFAFSHDGKQLAIIQNRNVLIHDFDSREQRLNIKVEHFIRRFIIRFSPDDRLLLVRTDAGVVAAYQINDLPSSQGKIEGGAGIASAANYAAITRSAASGTTVTPPKPARAKRKTKNLTLELDADVLLDYLCYTRLPSALNKLKELVARNKLDIPGCVVVWDQTSGRSQAADSWWATEGSLTVAYAIPALNSHSIEDIKQLTLKAVQAFIAARTQRRPEMQHPNLILLNGEKIARVAVERIGPADLLDIAINIYTDFSKAPPEIQEGNTNLYAEKDRPMYLHYFDFSRVLFTQLAGMSASKF